MPLAIANIYDSKGNVLSRSNFGKGEQIRVDVVSKSMIGLPYWANNVNLLIQDNEHSAFSPVTGSAQVDIKGHANITVTMPSVDAGAILSVWDDVDTVKRAISIGAGYAPTTDVPEQTPGINELGNTLIGGTTDITGAVKYLVIGLLVVAAIGLVFYGVSKFNIKIPKIGGIR